MKPTQIVEDPQPRWPAIISLIAVAGLYEALPKALQISGPRGLLVGLVVFLLVPTLLTHHYRSYKLNRFLGLSVAAVVTFFLLAALIQLVAAMLHLLPDGHVESPRRMLLSAGALWISNVLVFALWYWHLDAGGPHARDLRKDHVDGAFLFPQMIMTPEARLAAGEHDWEPGFVDYLFLAFNTSSALSPTDTAVLSRWAKLLMMLQAMISLTVIALLASRAVNILSP